MALDVYFREDILNVLRATLAASGAPASLLSEFANDARLSDVPLDRLVDVYRQGFCTALGAVGLAFGLDSPVRCPGPQGNRSPAVVAAEPFRGPASLRQAGGLPSDAPAFLSLGAWSDRERR